MLALNSSSRSSANQAQHAELLRLVSLLSVFHYRTGRCSIEENLTLWPCLVVSSESEDLVRRLVNVIHDGHLINPLYKIGLVNAELVN